MLLSAQNRDVFNTDYRLSKLVFLWTHSKKIEPTHIFFSFTKYFN